MYKLRIRYPASSPDNRLFALAVLVVIVSLLVVLTAGCSGPVGPSPALASPTAHYIQVRVSVYRFGIAPPQTLPGANVAGGRVSSLPGYLEVPRGQESCLTASALGYRPSTICHVFENSQQHWQWWLEPL